MRTYHGLTPAERFWKYTDTSGECWVWTAGCATRGYGQLWIKDRFVQAHRFSWELANGPIPDGLWVLHRCDNRPCVRPDHLFLGTPRDNSDDMIAKGRKSPVCGEALLHLRPDQYVRGLKHGRAIFTPEQIREMRRRHAAGEHCAAIARELGLVPSTVWQCCTRRTYADVD